MEIQFVRVEKNEGEKIVITYSRECKIVDKLKKYVEQLNKENSKIELYKQEKSYLVDIDSILFFETENGEIIAHTKTDSFKSKSKLYELEEMLPSFFLRVSKSTVLNIKHIYSIDKDITSSSCIEFLDTYKTVYVSRRYYKDLKNKLKEMRIRI